MIKKIIEKLNNEFDSVVYEYDKPHTSVIYNINNNIDIDIVYVFDDETIVNNDDVQLYIFDKISCTTVFAYSKTVIDNCINDNSIDTLLIHLCFVINAYIKKL